ncbi:MAG: cysteine desulfurase family protein [Thermodesulfobacteriota bacterium]
MIKPIYLDYNATTPHAPEVIEAMRPYLEIEFGNPSSSHWYGIRPKKGIINAREQVASLINCAPQEVFFTSGGTESNNHAIRWAAEANAHRGKHLITSRIEHPATLSVFQHLEKSGFRASYLPVDSEGLLHIEDLEKAICSETILISIMHANNEVGTIQPIREISVLAKKHSILLHSDAAQSLGKIPTDVDALGVDLLSMAGHKIYAPKGVGALYVNPSCAIKTLFYGAGQEMGKRPGTENVLGIVGLGAACEIAKKELSSDMSRMKEMRDRLYRSLAVAIPGIRMNGHPEKRLPNTLSLSFENLEANRILEEIGLEVAASAGAACHSDRVEISHVLKAMNVPLEFAKGTIRLSTGRFTTFEEIDRAASAIIKAVHTLKKSLRKG